VYGLIRVSEIRESSILLSNEFENWHFIGAEYVYEGLRLGLSGLDTLIVICVGLGETDLNQTVLLGITFSPTWEAKGSLNAKILDYTKRETWLDYLTIYFVFLFHWKNVSAFPHWQVLQSFLLSVKFEF